MMMNPSNIDGIAAFTEYPSKALTAASPTARMAVERHYRSEEDRTTVKLEPTDDAAPFHLQRTISYNTSYYKYYAQPGLPPAPWWLDRASNRDIPLALELPVDHIPMPGSGCCLQLYIGEVPKPFYPFENYPMKSYLSLKSLQTLTLYGISENQIDKMRGSEHAWESYLQNRMPVRCFEFIPPMPNLRVLRLRSVELHSVQLITQCRQLRVLELEDVRVARLCLKLIAGLEHLTSLSIQGYQVEDTDWLAECQNLETLDIRCASLPPISEMPKLKYLRMLLYSDDVNAAASRIIDDAPSSTLSCTSPLVHVDLGGGDNHHIDWISKCPAVEVLSLRKCEQVTDFTSVGHLSWLQKLDISYTQASSIDWITGCVSLTELRMGYLRAQVKDYAPIGDLKNLTFLCISATKEYSQAAGSTAAAWLPQCTALEHLHADCWADIDFVALSALKHLRTLSLTMPANNKNKNNNNNSSAVSGGMVSLEGLSQCTHLESVSLYGRRNIADFVPLTRLPCLRTLDVRATNLISIECLAACPLLSHLSVARDLVAANCNGVSKFPSLRFVCLGKASDSEKRPRGGGNGNNNIYYDMEALKIKVVDEGYSDKGHCDCYDDY